MLSAPAPSTAATPCWKTVVGDWSKDNTVDGNYPAACIRDAMVYAPTDLKIYSSLEDDLQSALRKRSARRLAGVHGTAASIATPGGSSSISPLVIVLGGIGILVATSAAVAMIRRRRTAR